MSETNARILVVDDDAFVGRSMKDYLVSLGYEADAVSHATDALRILSEADEAAGRGEENPVAVMITDMVIPAGPGLTATHGRGNRPGNEGGIELIKQVRKQFPSVVPLAITGYGTIETAVQTIRLGAVDYLTKPIVDEELRIAVEKAIAQHALRSDNKRLREQLDQRMGLGGIVGTDTRMRHIYDVVQAVAPTRTTVLMAGESGTGKSLIARAIHRASPRADKPFVEISCGSIPETLLESELFGHVKGAFTGAHADKVGRFLAAHTGTLFLDEINSASPGMQLKLLRVLQERTFEPVGTSKPVEVDVRVILASNQPLEELVANGQFRQDLFYRINVVMIPVPPLRDRAADIPMLATYFLNRIATEVGKQVTGFTPDALTALQSYAFPGNVRELENIIERAVVLTHATKIELSDLPSQVISPAGNPLLRLTSEHRAMPWLQGPWQPMPLERALQEPERQIILAALEANNWNRQKTADDLQINRTTLYKKIKQYNLEELGRAG